MEQEGQATGDEKILRRWAKNGEIARARGHLARDGHARDRGDVQDASAAGVAHPLEHELTEVPGGRQVGRDQAIERLGVIVDDTRSGFLRS